MEGGGEYDGECAYETAPKPESKKKVEWHKVGRYILGMKMELCLFFFAFPIYINIIGLPLLPLEKACKINLKYPDNVCRNLNNGQLKESCVTISEFLELNKTEQEFVELIEEIGRENEIPRNDLAVLRDVCFVETEAQKLLLDVNQKRAPLGYLALIVIILAGPLGDKYNRKKPFLLLPMMGQLFSVLAYFISSYFQTTVPMEFHLYLEHIVTSLSGGYSLFLMGIFSFLAATTTEEERTFRFGVFSVFNAGLGIVIQPLAKPVFEGLGYVNLFLLGLLVHLCGCVYILFFIDEVPKQDSPSKPLPDSNKSGIDNAAFELTDQNQTSSVKKTDSVKNGDKEKEETETINKNILKECLDLFVSNFKVFQIPRPHSARKILLIIISCYLLLAFSNGEFEVAELFKRESWGWTTQFAFYNSYSTFIGFIGTLIVTALLVEVWKLADPILVMISLGCSIVAKPILAITKDFYIIYLATTIELFNSTKVIAIRSLISKVVAADELGRVYSVMSIIETLVNPLTSIIYNYVYAQTISSFPGLFYFMTVGIFAVVFIVYFKVNSLVRHFVKMQEKETPATENGIDSNENVQTSKV
uniref:CSON013922 protein n=1 Tax=Culicoides sonorensis TaxID=179676 RepID=A0A336MET8_CULSO